MSSASLAIPSTLVTMAIAAVVPGNAAAARDRTPGRVSAEQLAMLPALRAPAIRSPTRRMLAFARGVQHLNFWPNPALARPVTPVGRDTKAPWYVIPANDSVCLFTNFGGTCAPNRTAFAGGLWIQLIKPVGDDPIPPPGEPVPSTIVGVVPEGFTAVSADTSSGAVPGTVSKGMFTVKGVDITGVHLLRPTTLDVRIPAPPGH